MNKIYKKLFGQNDTSEDKSGGDVREENENSIRDMGSVVTENNTCRIHTLVVAGQIEGHYELPGQNKTTKYEHVIPQLVQVEESADIDGLLMILNTVGGDVEAGLAIAELVSGMKKPTVSLVIGGGHSIGVPLAVCAKKSFIVPSATMTIHPVRTNGLVIGVPQTFTYLLKMQERISGFVVKNSRVDEETLTRLMMETDELAADVGSVIDGIHAVNIGLIDEVGGLSNALEALHDMIDEYREQRS